MWKCVQTKFGGYGFSGFRDIATIIFSQISLLNHNVLSLLSQAPSIKFLLASHQKLAKSNFLILRLHFTLNLFMLNLIYHKNHPPDFCFIYTKKMQNFVNVFQDIKANFLIDVVPIFIKVFIFDESYLKNRSLDYWFLYTIKLQIFSSIYVFFRFLMPTF